ncbi:hypothetical protein VTK56DRAFT_9565 [Thermocarpiscus australiensis]
MMRPAVLSARLRLRRRHFPGAAKAPTQTQTQPLLIHLAPYTSSSSSSSSSYSPTFNPDSYLHHATQKFASQPPSLIPDMLSPTPSHLLTLSLADHVPSFFSSSTTCTSPRPSPRPGPKPRLLLPSRTTSPARDLILPQGHHLVYFPPQLPPSRLMPDGTDPAHWPGAPFVRRMWAGGAVLFREGWDRAMRVDGRRAVCVESVGGGGGGGGGGGQQQPAVVMKGRRGQERVFVEVRRRYGVEEGEGEGDEVIAERIQRGGAVIEEVRNLVFMREREERAGEGEGEVVRVVRASATPEFTYELKPDATLLFHFSALTYNAHAIHINPDYARTREGYRNLLVHGPLTLVLMISALRASLAQVLSAAQLEPGDSATAGQPDVEAQGMPYVKSISYRNLAPLYVDEQMKVCLRRTTRPGGADLHWDVWIEGPDGGLAVKGSAVTTGIGRGI